MTSVVHKLDDQDSQSPPETLFVGAHVIRTFGELFDLTPVPAPASIGLHQHQ